MIRPANTITHLAELPVRRARRTQVSGFDTLFLGGAALAILAGCGVLLDQGAAYSSGQGSLVADLFTQAVAWVPGALASAGKYTLLLLASILNSALIVLLVQGLRTLDRTMRRLPQGAARMLRRQTKATSSAVVRAPAAVAPAPANAAGSGTQSSGFLLSPVFR